MTGAIDHVSNGIPDLLVAALQQMIEQSRALGITWSVRLATVSTSSPLTITYDGDNANNTSPMTATSMIGPLLPQQRVYGLIVPPAANFVIGYAGTKPPTSIPFFLNGQTTDGGIVASSVGAEAAIPSGSWDTEPLYTFDPLCVFQVHMTGLYLADDEGATMNIKVRLGAATTSGTQLAAAQWQARGGNNGQTFDHLCYFVNTSNAAISSKLSLTVTRVAGGGTISLFGNGGFPIFVSVSRIGTTANLAGLTINVADVNP